MDKENSFQKALNWVEQAGNRLPHPVVLFFWASMFVLVLSQLAEWLNWRVTKTVVDAQGAQREVEVAAQGLLDSDGLWWVISHLVKNFIEFPPLALVLVAMLGIGVAERTGLIAALIRVSLKRVPDVLLTPSVFFIAVMSSMALDAGYVVLPPLAAALYLAMGRSPIAGIATAFAGVSAGFSANLFITAIDPLLAGFTQASANLIDEGYVVSATANWWLMIVSTFVLTLIGWWVTAKLVEPRLNSRYRYELDEASSDINNVETAANLRGLKWAAWVTGLFASVIGLLIVVPGAPLHGMGTRFDRWVEAIVPLIFLMFVLPGIAYGYGAGVLNKERGVPHLMGETLANLGPYIVLAFFAAQFIAFFKQSNLGEMLAIVGGEFLVFLDLPVWMLLVMFMLVVMSANLFIGSASAKYAFFAPVFVPMLMQVGMSPELTQAAYRIGDSVTNIITPLNPYIIVILAFLQRYLPSAGIGTLIAIMLPYALVFALTWIVLLVIWVLLGLDLGPEGPLWV